MDVKLEECVYFGQLRAAEAALNNLETECKRKCRSKSKLVGHA